MQVSLSLPLSLSEIITAIGGTSRGVPETLTVTELSTDSRHITAGCLFFALPGERYNGEDFVSDVIRRGGIPVTAKTRDGAITVCDTTEALLSLAAFFKSKLKRLTHTVAITGSVGKTTTKNMLADILSLYKTTHATYKNFNNAIGVSLSVLSAPKDTEILVLEIGMNHKGEIERIVKHVQPDIAIITCIGYSHIGNLGSREAIAGAKWEIAAESTRLTLCDCSAAKYSNGRAKAVVAVDGEADFSLKVRALCASSADFDFTYRGGAHSYIGVPILGRHNLQALAFALAAATVIGADLERLKSGISRVCTANNSGKFIELSDCLLYDDSYNSSYESVIADTEMLSMLGRGVSLILGDILELGEQGPVIHYELGRELSGRGINNLYLFGELSEHIGRGARDGGMDVGRIFHNPDITAPEATAECVLKNRTIGEAILLKASNKIGINRIGELLKRKERTR